MSRLGRHLTVREPLSAAHPPARPPARPSARTRNCVEKVGHPRATVDGSRRRRRSNGRRHERLAFTFSHHRQRSLCPRRTFHHNDLPPQLQLPSPCGSPPSLSSPYSHSPFPSFLPSCIPLLLFASAPHVPTQGLRCEYTGYL